MIFGGIPIRVDPCIPEDEIWMVQQGKKQTLHIHEGQRAGQTVEQWLTKPTVFRIVNIADSTRYRRQSFNGLDIKTI